MLKTNRFALIMMVLMVGGLCGFVMSNAYAGDDRGTTVADRHKMDIHLKADDTVRNIVEHPAFKGFGHLMLPREHDTLQADIRLQNVRSLMPWHSNMSSGIVLNVLNHMIDDVNGGNTIFYDFYSAQQKRDDPAKEHTGIFFFRGEPGAPFAVVCPGGGFAYVGSLHEGFPLALEISRNKFNAFVIRYRIGGQRIATEDLAAAITYIFRNADKLRVGTDGYSLWGGSAGARMVGNIALSGVAAYGGADLPKPSTAVIAYTGQSGFSRDFPPTFITVAENDSIVNISVVDRRVKNLRNAGVEVEYRRYRTAGHGFGLGTGTDAEGWLDHAVQFWKKHMNYPLNR